MSRAEDSPTQSNFSIREVTTGKTLMMVEHDMSVVFDSSDCISVLVYGTIIATGTPEEIRNNQEVREAYLGLEAVDAPRRR